MLLAVLGALSIVQPDGSVKFYATFPMGWTQMSVLELDTGKTWMIRIQVLPEMLVLWRFLHQAFVC